MIQNDNLTAALQVEYFAHLKQLIEVTSQRNNQRPVTIIRSDRLDGNPKFLIITSYYKAELPVIDIK